MARRKVHQCVFLLVRTLDTKMAPPSKYRACSCTAVLLALCAAGITFNFVAMERRVLLDDARGVATFLPAQSAPRRSTAVATYESYGFFDDVDDEDWRRRQERARSHRHQMHLPSQREVTPTTDSARWYMLNYYPLFTCPNQERVGGPGDGPKWVCDPLRLKREPAGAVDTSSSSLRATTSDSSVTSNNGTTPPCLVYSIGSQGNYVFEDGLVDLVGVGTCEIHVFDVFADYTRPNDAPNRGIHFHHVGLGSSYSDLGRKEGSTYLTLQEVMHSLGHLNRTIDIFKIDCEHCTFVWLPGATSPIL
jgi:Methyltransferase domain